MKKFELYVDQLQGLTSPRSFLASLEKYKKTVEVALDGQPSQQLRKSVSLASLRKSGAFFTGHELADKLVLPHKALLKNGISVFDPAIGAGDLLIACAKSLPIKKTLEGTLDYWGTLLGGRDIHEQFIRATKIRLLLLAQKRCTFRGEYQFTPEKLFPKIREGNFFDTNLANENYGLIVTNPPYTRKRSPKICEWAEGSITIAALFIEKCINESKTNTVIAAILPDVLRAGTRYRKWRELIANRSNILTTKIIGAFDALTDVDVFQIHLVAGTATNSPRWSAPRKAHLTLGDIATVKVGTVVPFRDEEIGSKYHFIEPSTVIAWKEVVPKDFFRNYNRTVFTPPFVVVRRTSGPKDRIRTVASIIRGKKEVAVENHLLVLEPKEGGLKTCRKLLKVLKARSTTKWVNEKIRCRHLTVSSVSGIPWIKD